MLFRSGGGSEETRKERECERAALARARYAKEVASVGRGERAVEEGEGPKEDKRGAQKLHLLSHQEERLLCHEDSGRVSERLGSCGHRRQPG